MFIGILWEEYLNSEIEDILLLIFALLLGIFAPLSEYYIQCHLIYNPKPSKKDILFSVLLVAFVIFLVVFFIL